VSKLPTTENDVKRLVIQWFKDCAGYSFPTPPSRGMGVHGIADRIGVIPITITPEMVGKKVGIFVAIEAKKPGRRGEKLGGATQAQVDFLREAFRAGGSGGLADCALDLAKVWAGLRVLSDPLAESPCHYADASLTARVTNRD
jgi:hypothetical protein